MLECITCVSFGPLCDGINYFGPLFLLKPCYLVQILDLTLMFPASGTDAFLVQSKLFVPEKSNGKKPMDFAVCVATMPDAWYVTS